MKKITLLIFLSFTIFGFSQDQKGKIQNYINDNKAKFGLTSQDIQELFVESELSSETTGINNYFVKQKYQGTELFNSSSNFWIKNNQVINGGDGLISEIASKINTTTPTLSVMQALARANTLLNIETPDNQKISKTIDAKNFLISNNTENEIKAKLVYELTQENKLNLAWDFTIDVKGAQHLWSVRIDAVSGKILSSSDLVISCNFGPKHNHNFGCTDNSKAVPTSIFKAPQTSMLNVTGGSYTVVPFNYESPNHSPRIAIVSPENAIASPKGWHDTNPLAANSNLVKYSYLRGNNTWTKADYNNTNNLLSSQQTNSLANDYSPGNLGLIFDYPYPGTNVNAKTYIDAAATNLFYMANILHDIWYQYGFNEPNGNFQQTNYVTGGAAGDYVYTDAQDGSTAATPTFNNANFSTPADGGKPRMQMYLWNVAPPFLYINSPVDIAGYKEGNDNVFSPGHVAIPIAPALIQSDLVLFDDGTPDNGETDNADACAPAVNAAALNGHIAVIRRSLAEALGGTPCSFIEKVKFAQNAGATAAIIVNNIDPDIPNNIPGAINMSGADATITIPAISLTKAVGYPLISRIKTETVNGKLQTGDFVNSDGDFDNGVITHEYGHGISSRLTGGPANASCLTSPEQMGEGWSDWFALMLQIKTGDVGTTPKGIGTFAVNEPTTGGGIRNFPYSTDMAVNPLTFGASNGTYFDVTYLPVGATARRVEPHNTGEIWTSVLWDLSWAYINRYGFNSNIYTGTGGNNKVIRLVLDAMKLQPCNPSYIQARDAIIAADTATGGIDNCMITEVFRRRGFGLGASSGSNSGDASNLAAIHDQVESFTAFPAGANCSLGINNPINEDLFNVYPNPTNGTLNVTINNFNGKVNIQIVDINGRIVKEYKNDNFNVETTLNMNNLQSGMYIIKVSGDEINFTKKIIKN